MNNDIKQSDLLKPKAKKLPKQVEKKEDKVAEYVEETVKQSINVPSGFIEVNFSSKDKLGPAVLHFRDYAMNELMEIGSANETNQSHVITKVLTNMCFEKYNCEKLHPNNIQEIMLAIYNNFWSNKFTDRPFLIDPDLGEVEGNIGYTDIMIQGLTLIDIDDKVKVPYTVWNKDKSKSVKFSLVTMESMFKAEKYAKKVFEMEEQSYRSIASMLQLKDLLLEKGDVNKVATLKLTAEDEENYLEFQRKKSSLVLKVMQAQLIYAVDDKVMENLEDQLAVYDSIDKDFWLTCEKVNEKIEFGLSDKYTFKYRGKEITRRFSFRVVDLLPSVDSERDSGFTVQFDD